MLTNISRSLYAKIAKRPIFDLGKNGLMRNTRQFSGAPKNEKAFNWAINSGGVILGLGAFGFGTSFCCHKWLIGQGTLVDTILGKFEVFCTKKDTVGKRECDEFACLHRLDDEEKATMKANRTLECALDDVKPKLQDAVETALKAVKAAKFVMVEYMDTGYEAIARDPMKSPIYEEVWCDMANLTQDRCMILTKALKSLAIADEYLCRLQDIVKNGKDCRFTNCNPRLIIAEESTKCAEAELAKARKEMSCAQSSSCMINLYGDVVKAFRWELEGEIEKCEELSDEERRGLVVEAAYGRVLDFQKSMALKLVLDKKVPPAAKCTQC